MGLADKLNSNIVSKGLGGEETLSTLKQVKGNLKIAIYEDKSNTKVVNSFAEGVPGWCFDKELVPKRNSDFHKLGGHSNLKKEGMLESDFNGSVIFGCEVEEIAEKRSIKDRENYVEWLPIVNRGVYSSLGNKSYFFGKNYQNKIAENESFALEEYWLLDTIRISTYGRNENFINNVSKSFNFEISDDLNSCTIIDFSIESFKETVRLYDSQKTLYLKNFPIKEIAINGINSDNYTVFKEAGVVFFKDLQSSRIVINGNPGVSHTGVLEGDYEISYSVAPIVEYEVYKKENRIGDKSIKPYEYQSPNGLIEISNEEKHVAELVLSTSETEVTAGNSSLVLTATCLNSRKKPVDEVVVDFFGDAGKDIVFEGNLSSYTSSTNAEGKAFAQAYFPLNRNSLCIVSSEVSNKRIYLPAESNNDYASLNADNTLVFAMLKVDPFYGSNGIDIYLTYVQEDLFEIPEEEFNRLLVKIKNSKNNQNKDFINFADIMSCGSVYNSAWVSYEIGRFSFRHKIVPQSKNKVKLEGIDQRFITARRRDFIRIKCKLFIKNDAGPESTNYLDKALYKLNNEGKATLVRPFKVGIDTTLGHNKRYYLEFEEDIEDPSVFEDLVGYRIFINQTKIFRAECIDPATGRKIFSNEAKVKISLPSYYKEEIKLLDSDPSTGYIGIGSYLMIDENLEQTYSLNSGDQQ